MELTIVLVVVNVLAFFGLSFGGMTEDAVYMLEHGAMYVPYMLENGEYYRLFTSLFLHFGFTHLLNNMVTLVIMGRYVEPLVGKVRFLIIYFISGLGGNLLSGGIELITKDYVVSAGASGAIFGLTGALLGLTLLCRGRVGQLTSRDVLIVVVLSLYNGFTSQGVDNAAHIGGLISGFLAVLVLVGTQKNKYRRQW